MTSQQRADQLLAVWRRRRAEGIPPERRLEEAEPPALSRKERVTSQSDTDGVAS